MKIQHGGFNVAVKTMKKMAIFKKSTDLDKIWYIGVFGVADHESEVRFAKFKMADPIWQTKFSNFNIFTPKYVYWGFRGR